MQITAVKLRNSYQICYVDCNNIFAKKNSLFIVNTEHGVDIGQITCCSKNISNSEIEVKGKILRKSTDEDLQKLPEIQSIENKAYTICKEKAKTKGLAMKIVSVKCLFDKTKIIFYFVADNRIDFRELVRELASIFRTRIEMRQIGVRDEAKLIGGYGPCGKQLCCVHLKEGFDPVSIKMAKEQCLNLNSLKISGMCGRLLCCLSYEYEVYKNINQNMPKIGTKITVGENSYTIESIESLKQKLSIRCGKHVISISRNDLTSDQKGNYSICTQRLKEIQEHLDSDGNDEK